MLRLLPVLDLADEIAAFRAEMSEILAAMTVGDLEAVGHIRRAHISMSFTRMLADSGAGRPPSER